MKTKRILTLLTAALLVLSLAACGTGKDSKKDDSGKRLKLQPFWRRSRPQRTRRRSCIKS